VDRLTRRNGEPYAAYIERVAADPLARRVKLADLADNLAHNRDVDAPADERAGGALRAGPRPAAARQPGLSARRTWHDPVSERPPIPVSLGAGR